MYSIGKDRILFLDNDFVDTKKSTARFSYGELLKKDVAMTFLDEWDREATYFNTVKEDGFYRMYYLALNRLDKQGNFVDLGAKAHVAAIESKDGITWYKPNYGVVEFNGSKDNNLINTTVFDNLFVYKDENEDCPPEQRYKALHMYYEPERAYTALKCSFSSDGINFKEGPILSEEGTFDSLNTLHYDKKEKRYVVYCRYFHNVDGSDFTGFKDVLNAGNKAIRDFRVMYSKDFKTWSKPKRVNLGDAPDYQLYTNNIERYYRSPRYYIGFPERYIENQKWDKNYDNLCGKTRRKKRMYWHPRLGLALTDSMFIHSTDGENFTMSNKAFLSPGPETDVSWTYGGEKLNYGLIETKNELTGLPEISMYSPCVTWEDHPTKLFRSTLRLDGFAYYSADVNVKKVVSKEFVFEGEKLYFNMATTAVGFVQVTLKTADGEKITSGKVFGDSTEKEIWFNRKKVKDFAGKPVIMEIKLKESNIYSFRFE